MSQNEQKAPADQPAANEEHLPAAEDALHTRIAALEAELANAKDQMLRALADSENTRKRALKDREDAGKYAIASFARDLLDFADNFHRALGAFPAELKQADERVRNVMSGIEAMEKELMRCFEKHGIEKVEPLDQPFNANFHEVLFEVPGSGKPAGTVVQVIEPGYVIKDRLLRPARVGVAKNDGPGPAGEPGSRIDTKA